MNSLRLLVNCLAALVGLVGIGWAALGPILLVHSLSVRESPIGQTMLLGIILSALVVAALGGLMMRQAWIHWRRPDRQTATTVSGLAALAAALYLLQLTTGRNAILPKWGGLAGAMLPLACAVSLIVACYLFYRLALKPLAARAYPI